MKIEEEVVEKCSKCGAYIKEISPEQYGCDFCSKRIEISDRKGKSSPYLRATIFYHEDKRDTKDIIFCSWKCLFSYLKKLEKKGIYFIALPSLTFDRKETPTDFFERIK